MKRIVSTIVVCLAAALGSAACTVVPARPYAYDPYYVRPLPPPPPTVYVTPAPPPVIVAPRPAWGFHSHGYGYGYGYRRWH